MKKLLLLPLLLAGLAPACAQDSLAPLIKPRSLVLRDPFAVRALAISGTVRTAGGQPLAGATVLVQGTRLGARTDARGRYTLAVPGAARATLVFSAVGFAPVARRVGKNVVLDAALKVRACPPEK